MIKEVKIYNRFNMDNFAAGLKEMPYKHWYLVSIYSMEEEYLIPERREKLKEMGMQDGLSLEFWDITEDMYKKIFDGEPILFTEAQAKQVVNFIDKAHTDPEDSVLVAHCSAGISRSGAVGTFVNDYCFLDYEDFIQNNRYISANPYVLSLLRRVAGMTPIGAHDGVDNDFEDGEILIP